MLCKLAEVAPLVADRVAAFEGICEYVATGSLDNFQGITSESVTYANRPSRADLTVKTNDLCFARMQSTEKVLLITEDNKNFIYSTGFAVIRPNVKIVFPRFLFHLIKSSSFQAKKDLLCSGATQKAITNEKINSIDISLPPLAEQQRIASILDKAELVKRKRELVVQKLDGLTHSVFVEMFGDCLTNDKNLNQIKLGDGITLFGGAAFKSADYVSDGIPLIRIGEVNRKEFDGANTCYLPQNFEKQYSRFLVRKNSLLMSLTGTTGKDDYGNVVLLNGKKEKYFLNQRVASIEPNPTIFVNEFLYYLLRNKEVKNQIISKSRGVRQANISNGDITNLLVIHPAIEEQLKFKKVIDGINYLADRTKFALALDAKLILSLQDNLLASRS